MKSTTQTFWFGRWIVIAGGALALGLTLGLGSVTAATNDFQPGDAAGHAAADLHAANERQEAGVVRANILTRPVFVPGDAAGHAATDLRNVNARQQAGFTRLFADEGIV
jgi:hypothetical protein